MGVIRVEKNKNFTVMSNYHFKDKDLSWKAKGILSLMLSLPEDWDYSISGLATLSTDGVTATRTAIQELEKCGYLTRTPVRQNGKIIDWDYIVYEYPQLEKLPLENLTVENLSVGFTPQLNTKELNTKEIKRTNNKNINPKQSSGLFPTKTSPTVETNHNDIVTEAVTHLNKVLGTNYQTTTTSTVNSIKTLINKNYTLEDIKCVIDYKYKEWKGTDMEKYLRPNTLFRLSKFESYINNARRGCRISPKNKYNDTDDGRQLQTAFRDLPKEEQEKILAKNKDGSLITF